MANALFEADFTGTGNNFQSCIPRNYKDTRFQVIFTNDFPSATLQAILFEFVNDPTGEKNADNIYQFIAKYGVNQGIPYRISVDGVPYYTEQSSRTRVYFEWTIGSPRYRACQENY